MNEQTAIVVPFDYSQLDNDTSALCHRTAQIAETFGTFTRRTIEKGFELGTLLIEVKEKLPPRTYYPFLRSIGLPPSTASYWVRKVEEGYTANISGITLQMIDSTAEEDEKLHMSFLPEQALEHVREVTADDIILYDEPVEHIPQPDSTEIDVAATVAENEQLKKSVDVLQSQLQDALQQQNGNTSPHKSSYKTGGTRGAPAQAVTFGIDDYGDFENYSLTYTKDAHQEFPFRVRVSYEVLDRAYKAAYDKRMRLKTP